MANKKGTNNNTNLMIKFLKTPIRFIVKARDLYVKSMMELSGQVYTTSVDTLPRSFTVNSALRPLTNDDDFRELVRIASTKKLGHDLLSKEPMPTKISRSRTVAFERIDEDEECDFSMYNNFKNTDLCLRSRSVAIAPKRTAVVF